MEKVISVKIACQKIEYYCKYQERCHDEVQKKLVSFNLNIEEIDQVFMFVIENNLLNEERFAINFTLGYHRIKMWGKVRIKNELKFKNISQRIIATALNQISNDEYNLTFQLLAEKKWNNILEKNIYKKQTKFCNFMIRKGFESGLIYEKVKEFL